MLAPQAEFAGFDVVVWKSVQTDIFSRTKGDGSAMNGCTRGQQVKWYGCSLALNSWFEIPPVTESTELCCGVRLEPVPAWVKSDAALKLLSWNDREGIRSAELALSVDYEADALGSPDPDWNGQAPRSIQASIDEKFALASLALWLVKPTRLTVGPVLHFGRKGDPTSLRQSGSLRPILTSDLEQQNVLTAADLVDAGRFLKAILSLRRSGAVWTAMWMLLRALSESVWEVRYLLQWVALEALFGPENPNEVTYRLAQRISLFLGRDLEERKRLFGEAKEAYTWRSKIVHGARLAKLTGEKSLLLSTTTEIIIRRAFGALLTSEATLLHFDGKDRDNFLDELIFR